MPERPAPITMTSYGAGMARSIIVSRRGGTDPLLDDSIGPQQDRRRNRQPERLRRLQIDHELELQGLLDGKVGRLHPPQDLLDQARRLFAELIGVGGVRGQAALLDEERYGEHRRQDASRRALEDEPR